MGQNPSRSKDNSPCAKCQVSNKFAILALGLLVFAMCAVVSILCWSIPLDQTFQITVTVLAAVSALFALIIAAIPKKCQKGCSCAENS